MKEIAIGINESLINEFEEMEECLAQKRLKFYFMETFEIDSIENLSGKYNMKEWAEMEAVICQQISVAVDGLKGSRFWQKRKLLKAMQSTKPRARLNHLTLAENYDHIERYNAMLGLAGLYEELYYSSSLYENSEKFYDD